MKVKLEEIAEIKAGHPFRGSIKESEQGNGYVIQTRDQSADGQINWDKLTLTNVVGRKEPDWLKKNDIIFAARGAKNLASVIQGISSPTVCTPHFFQIYVKDPNVVLPQFLAWQLNQQKAQRYFQKSAEGSVQVSIRRTILENTPIMVPSIEKQKLLINLVTASRTEEQHYKRLVALRKTEIQAVSNQILNEIN